MGKSLSVEHDQFLLARKEIAGLIRSKNCAPLLILLSWHDSGTFDVRDRSGGPHAVMRFEGGEAAHKCNRGLEAARSLLAPIKAKFPDIGTADLWSLAAVVSIEEMGGPEVLWRAGRRDATSVEEAVSEGRLPDPRKGQVHLREVFNRMGMNDQEIVVLHCLNRCTADRSGFDGFLTPSRFSNAFYHELFTSEWEKEKKEDGQTVFCDKTKKMVALPSDMCLLHDEGFLPHVERYAKNEKEFLRDFAAAFQKLQELGMPAEPAPQPNEQKTQILK